MGMMMRPPKGGAWHDVDEVVRRLTAEFARVEVTKDNVKQYAESVSRSFRAAGKDAHADKVDAAQDRGLCLLVMDGDPQQSLFLIVLPEIPIMTGFASMEHLEAIQPLLRRAAGQLGYDLA